MKNIKSRKLQFFISSGNEIIGKRNRGELRTSWVDNIMKWSNFKGTVLMEASGNRIIRVMVRFGLGLGSSLRPTVR